MIEIEGLIINIIALLSASTISSILFAKYKNKIHFRGIFQGIIIGFLGILMMTNAISSSSGMIFDTRSILVSTLAMFFGIVSTCIAVFIISFYRIMIGGTGAFAGILMMIAVAVMGILWNRFRLSVIKKNIWIEFYAFGIATNVIVLLCALTLQQGMTLKVLKEISAIVLIIYPVAMVLICSIIFKGFQAAWVQSEPNNNKRGREPLKIETISNYFMNKFHMKLDQPINVINKSVAALNESVQANNTYLYMNQDVLEINKTKEALQKKQILIMSLLNVIPDLVFYKDCEGVYMGCNKAFEKFVGTSENGIVGKTDFDLFDKDVATKFRVMDVKMIKQKSNRRNEETVTYPDGTQVRLDTLKTPYYDSQGNTLGLIGVSRNISELKLKEEKIIYLNYHDSLTDLYNHTFFDKEMRRINAREQVPVSIIIGDINGLKLINDVFGYLEGDRVLKETAKIFRNCCHVTDVVARTGGDEFKVLLPGVNASCATTILKSIKKECEEYAIKTAKEDYYISISLGCSTKSTKDESLSKVLGKAEEYMRRRKLLEHKSLHSSIMASIQATMFEKSYETEEHAERLAVLSELLGRELGFDEEQLVELELLSMVHDIGKISVDRNVLTKMEKLSEKDWEELKKHPEAGWRILQTIPELVSVSEYVLCHHERWDGKGYPQGLVGENIPLLARVLSVVDAYDAMTQDRGYKKAMSKEHAISEILENAGTQFDPQIAKIFIEKVLLM